MDDEAGQQAFDTTSGGTDSNPERSDDDDNESDTDGGSHDPMNSWEEPDADAIYQTKRVDPEMLQWILTRDCRRIISDEFFNNPVRNQGTHNLLLEDRADCFIRAPVGLVLRQLYTEKGRQPPLRIDLRLDQLSRHLLRERTNITTC
jgi:hypothetical protein